MAIPIYDSRFPKEDYDRMAAAVADTQMRRATIAGPPVPTPSFSMQGVEKRAADRLQMQQDMGPMPKMIVNGVPSFTPPPAQAPQPAPMPAPMMAQTPRPAPMMMAPAPAPMAAPAPNSLSRGAAPRGLGGVAPTPTGRSRFDPQRMAEMMVRRRDPRGAQFLFGRAMQADSQNFQREMFGTQQQAEGMRDARNFDQGLQMFGAQQQAMNERDAMNFQQQQQMFQQESARRAGESDLEWQRRREAEAADREAQSIVGGEQLPMMGGAVPLVKRKDGTLSMAGGFIPTQKAEVPLTADEIQAARMMGGDVNIQQGNTQIRLPGMAPDKPTRLTPIPGAPSQIAGQPATPDRVFDPYAGAFYEAGQVPGRGGETAPATVPKAAATADPKARMNALRKRLGLAEL